MLLIHGRSGGVVPPELGALAAALQHRRGAPVILETLTADELPLLPASPAESTTVVPLFLLPGGHVRRDVPLRLARWRAAGPVKALPFLGAWPAWQRVLTEEVERCAGGRGGGAIPLLVHHPVEGSLPQRYLAYLASFCGARCLAVPYADAEGLEARPEEPALPLALAASRLTEGLGSWLGPPLLARPPLSQALLDLLVALP